MPTPLQFPPLLRRCQRFALVPGLALCLLATVGPAQASAGQPLMEQPITLQARGERMATVLSKIETQANVHFQYSRQLIGAGRRVSVDAVGQPLAQLLAQLLEPLHISYKVIDDGIILRPALAATADETRADATVTGRVVDEKGVGLPGVNVVIKGGTNGTQTDMDGKFTLAVPEGSTLVFSFVGYTPQEVAVGSQTSINVALLPDAKALSEVVVVGYGTQRRQDLTGAVARVEGTEIVNQPVQTPTQALQGKIAGVQIISDGTPNSQPKVRIRGTGTLLGGAEPLYVVDGVQTTDIRNLSNADIATIDVLKDASAAAIYGVRGANGVIIVTTKQGKLGKPVLSYSGTAGFKEAAHLVKMADAGQYASYLKDISPTTVLPDYSGSTNWYNEILKRGTYQNHNLAVSGASENVKYYFSGNLLQDDGTVINNKFQRLTIRSNTSFALSDKVTISSNASFSHADTRDVNIATAYGNAYRAAPIIPAKVDGLYGNTSAFGSVGNPVLDIENTDNKSLENRLQGNIGIDVRPVEGLTLRSAINVDLNADNRRVYQYQFANDKTTFLTTGGAQRNPQSQLAVTQVNGYRYLWENTATYQRTFNEKHNLTLLAGTVTEEGLRNVFSGIRKDVPADPNLWYLNTGDPNTATNDANAAKDRRLSLLGRINYAYDNRYLFTTNLRYDGTSKFNRSQRWGFFPSLGLGWVISQEDFLRDNKTLSFLKLRASYGQLGNDQIPADTYILTTDSNIPYVFNGKPVLGSAIRQIKDRNVHWETTTEYDAALEFGLLDNHLTGEVTYYDKRTTNALIPVNIQAVFGDPDGQYITNAADITNRGVEAALNWRAAIGSSTDWSYNIGANVTFNKNRIANLNGGQALFGGDNLVTKSDNGVAAGSFYLLNVIGVYQSADEIAKSPTSNVGPREIGSLKYEDTNGDGVIDLNDRQYFGSYQPPVYFGINGGLNFRNVDFSFVFSGNLNNKIFNAKKRARNAITDNVEASFATDRWTAANPSNTNPKSLISGMPNSTYFLESGSYLRLTNLVLGYTVPGTALEKAHLASVRVFAAAQNVFTVTKYTGFTPELPGGPLDSGIELNSYPTSRTVTLGLNVNFK
ncbi:SusC/RagA family TonB-linked outer membrane protein [Hymenobacter artigasi]|uniref:TonB-linked SusC/RagA family outer membrane protein n=1 Tax=Hymenobacter artigasi TaxID=2719616 RepID=A0ABX1HIQ8_9BACT|nr:TonB-dependent receptor [Hymenobacter artigasi]NKI90154.1 TonB-linked SusC/RagA family outer membrane protein [Hymenobacter artigasi]